MCFCESDAIKILIHIKARRRFPGIRFDDAALTRTAAAFHITRTADIRSMTEPVLAELSQTLLRFLPADACPPGDLRTAV